MGRRRQRPAGHQPGPDLVDHGDHEGRPRRAAPARPGPRPQRGRRLRRGGRQRPHHRAHRGPAAFGRSRSCSAWRSPDSASARRCSSSARRATTRRRPGSRRRGDAAAARPRVPRDLARCCGGDRADRRLFAASQAGLVNNLNDGLAWGLLPLFYAASGPTIAEIAILAAIYPAIWGVAQIGTGALSDRVGRRPLIVTGMLLQAWRSPGSRSATASGRGRSARSASAWAPRSSIRRSSPRLRRGRPGLAGIGHRRLSAVARPRVRGRGLLAGLIADAAGVPAAIVVVAALTAASGLSWPPSVAARRRDVAPVAVGRRLAAMTRSPPGPPGSRPGPRPARLRGRAAAGPARGPARLRPHRPPGLPGGGRAHPRRRTGHRRQRPGHRDGRHLPARGGVRPAVRLRCRGRVVPRPVVGGGQVAFLVAGTDGPESIAPWEGPLPDHVAARGRGPDAPPDQSPARTWKRCRARAVSTIPARLTTTRMTPPRSRPPARRRPRPRRSAPRPARASPGGPTGSGCPPGGRPARPPR